ncbi:histidine kinase [Longimicrobium sp.]|uniref:histidine kinase n=1 Tax=Longimicrobium sp. TaxID=2029185 RepID=UPI002E2F29A1|nr:histidine kinase [Longimicrobium sp.]HEX6041417.1 histidine kinase [Longimicrobium sp.]
MIRRVRHPWFRVAFTALWLVDALAHAAMLRLYLAPGETWTTCLLTGFYDSAGWALICAAGYGLAWRTPLEGPSVARRLARLAGVAALLVAIRLAVVDGLSRVTALPGLPERPAVVAMLGGQLLTAVLALGLGYAVAYFFRYREQAAAVSRAQAQLARAELSALQAQLNPHFLFNALNSVAALMHVDAGGARRVLDRLGQLLRVSLERSGAAMVPLGDELDFVAAYLEIEQARMGGRLSVRVQADAAARAVPVPHLVLQPLVENAVKHGLATRRGPGRVEVRAMLAGRRLRLEVADDGVGLPHGWSPDRVGVGIGNTRARLEQLYGRAHRFRLMRGKGGGVRARVVLPRKAVRPRPAPAAPVRPADARMVEREVLPWAAAFWAAHLVLATAALVVAGLLGGPPATAASVLRSPVANTAAWLATSFILLRVAGCFPFTRGRRMANVVLNAAAVLGLTLAFVGMRSAVTGAPFARTFHLVYPAAIVIATNLLGIAHALHYRVASREQEVVAARLEARRARTELSALQAQVHPRLMFDALDAVSARMGTDVPAAERLLARLGDLLRLSLGRADADTVPLADALDHAAAYLEVARAARGERTTVTVDADPPARAVPVPRGLLRPLLDDALRATPGRVTLHAAVADGGLRVTLETGGDAGERIIEMPLPAAAAVESEA